MTVWGVRINTLYNPFYQSTNSLVSLWIARSEFDEDIVIMNGDDVYEIGRFGQGAFGKG